MPSSLSPKKGGCGVFPHAPPPFLEFLWGLLFSEEFLPFTDRSPPPIESFLLSTWNCSPPLRGILNSLQKFFVPLYLAFGLRDSILSISPANASTEDILPFSLFVKQLPLDDCMLSLPLPPVWLWGSMWPTPVFSLQRPHLFRCFFLDLSPFPRSSFSSVYGKRLPIAVPSLPALPSWQFQARRNNFDSPARFFMTGAHTCVPRSPLLLPVTFFVLEARF